MPDLQRDPAPNTTFARPVDRTTPGPQAINDAADRLAAEMDLVAGQWAAASASGDRKWQSRRRSDGGGYAAVGSDDGFTDMNQAIELGAVHRGMVRAWELLTGESWTGVRTGR
jgi:hypothetical protein